MERAAVAYLGTVDAKGYPQVRAMANPRDKDKFGDAADLFAGHEEDFLLYFATGISSDKVKHIKANPAATVYFCDGEGMGTLLLCGDAKIINDSDIKKKLWRDGWERHFPDGPEDTEYTLLKFEPVFAKGLYQMEPFGFRL